MLTYKIDWEHNWKGTTTVRPHIRMEGWAQPMRRVYWILGQAINGGSEWRGTSQDWIDMSKNPWEGQVNGRKITIQVIEKKGGRSESKDQRKNETYAKNVRAGF